MFQINNKFFQSAESARKQKNPRKTALSQQ